MPLFIIDDFIDLCVDVWMSGCGVANFDLKNLKNQLGVPSKIHVLCTIYFLP